MVGSNSVHRDSVEKWSSSLVLTGGALMVAHAAVMAVQAFTQLATPPDVFAPTASVLVFVGLAGLYRTLAHHDPVWARVGVACLVLGTVGFSAIAVGNIAELGGLQPPDWFALFTVPAIIGLIPGFLAFGIASLRADIRSRTFGLLLLVPAALSLGLVANVIVLRASPLGGLIIGSGLALAYLSIGFSLRTGASSADSAPQTSDVAAG